MLTIVSGLPGAGKSTFAGQVAADTAAVLVGRDRVRVALTNLRDESALTHVLVAIAEVLVQTGHSVVVDAWNLHPDDARRWQDLARRTGTELSWVHISTEIDECVRRDASRLVPNGEIVVRAAAERYADRLSTLGTNQQGEG